MALVRQQNGELSILKAKVVQTTGLVEKKDRELKVLRDQLRCGKGSLWYDHSKVSVTGTERAQ